MSVLAIDPAVHGTVRIALTLLFLWAAGHKLRDVPAFCSAVANYELVPSGWIGPFATGVIAMELGVAAGLWLPRLAAIAALAAAGVLAAYAGAMAINLVRGRRDIDCGCIGAAGRRPLSGALEVRNGVLALAALTIAPPAAARPLAWFDAITIGAGAAALACLYAASEAVLANAPKIAALQHE